MKTLIYSAAFFPSNNYLDNLSRERLPQSSHPSWQNVLNCNSPQMSKFTDISRSREKVSVTFPI